MDESLALHHEFGIDATNNWGGGAPLLITSNTGNDIPVRSTAMLINDPRKGLDEGLCNECTEVLLFIHVPVKKGRACVVVACRYVCMFWVDKFSTIVVSTLCMIMRMLMCVSHCRRWKLTLP